MEQPTWTWHEHLTALFQRKSASSFNVLEIWLDIVTDFKLGNLLWNKLQIEQEYPIICFQADVKSYVTGCTQKTGTYLSLERNTDTPNVVVIGYTGTEACNVELSLHRKSIVLYFD